MSNNPAKSASWRVALTWASRAAFGAALVFLVLRLISLADGEWGPVFLGASLNLWPVLLLLVTSIAFRSRSGYQTLSVVMAGFFAVISLAMITGRALTNVIDPLGAFRFAFLTPLLEELLKLLPLLVAVLLTLRRPGTPGVLDYGLIGFASGAGFAWHEDMMWGRVTGTPIFTEPLAWVLPSVHTETGLVSGHVVWTGMVCLAIGVAMTRRNILAWAGVLIAFAIALFDHGSWNYPPLREGWRWILLDGWLPIGLLLALIILAFVLDRQALSRLRRTQRAKIVGLFRYAFTGNPLGALRRWWDARRLMRAFIRFGYGQALGIRDLTARVPATTAEEASA